MPSLSIRQARRLALCKAGLLKPDWLGLPESATGRGPRARSAALRIIQHFGYLQLDTVSIAGARSHCLVLLSRLPGLDPELGECLLQPNEPLFEYWGHEACWMPIDMYPAFEFRRQEFSEHPWWGDLATKHADVADRLRTQIQNAGAIKSVDMEGQSGSGWWNLKVAKKVASALWSSGELAIVERRNFQRSFDFSERVIAKKWRQRPLSTDASMEMLLLKALDGHGWATATTLKDTWRLRNKQSELKSALAALEAKQRIVSCQLSLHDKSVAGWIKVEDLDLIPRLERLRPRRDRGVLLSPFDPVLWDRKRVRQLFDFDQKLEIFTPANQRRYGYFCLPVLAGEWLVARVDLKAHRKEGRLEVCSLHFEQDPPTAEDQQAVRHALSRYADAVGLQVDG